MGGGGALADLGLGLVPPLLLHGMGLLTFPQADSTARKGECLFARVPHCPSPVLSARLPSGTHREHSQGAPRVSEASLQGPSGWGSAGVCSARWLRGLAACQPGGRVSWGRV